MKNTGYTGKLFEGEVLGECKVAWDGYMSYKGSMELVRENQPWDPSDPESRVANDLHASVAITAGIEDFEELKLFTALGTPLDYFHGVDAWFEFRGSVLTVDVTTNRHKDEYKADMVIHLDDLDEENLSETAARIAALLVA